MAKQVVQVLSAAESVEKVSKKGSKYKILEAQCILHEEGSPLQVGVIKMFGEHQPIKPGFYEPVAALVRSFDGNIELQIVDLKPTAAIVAAPQSQAKAA